ncbi:MAG: hypothetical protein HUJ42_02130 [Malacoplasma sp.]|nr:hypothetical protein [Malacoplasma sp.]
MNKRGYFSNDNSQTYFRPDNYRSFGLKYEKKQVSVLNTGLLTAGLGFLYVALIGFLFEYLVFLPVLNGDTSSFGSGWSIALICASVGIIVGSIMSLIWSFRVYKASSTFALITIAIYTTASGIGLGALFAIIELLYQNGLGLIMSAFGLIAAIFLGSYLITKLISFKFSLTLTKIVMVASIVGSLLFIGMLIASFAITSLYAYRVLWIAMSAISIVLGIIFLVYNLWIAQSMDRLYMENELSKKMGLFIGFQILSNMIMLLFAILRIIALSKR